MMKNYNFTPENIDDINIQKSDFFALISEQSANLVDLQVLSYKDFDTAEKLFWTKFIQNHEEIRADIRLTRHFIIKKKDKLMKELKTPLFMSNIYDNLMDETKSEYWKFVHTVFLLLESCHNEKNDAIINTLTSELEKLVQKEEEVVEEVVEEEVSKDKKVNKKIGRYKKKEEMPFDMSKVNEMLGKIGGNSGLDMSKITEMMGGLMNGSGNLDMSKMGEMMGGLGENNNMGGFDMSKMGEMMGGLMNSMGGKGGKESQNLLEGFDMSKMGEMMGGLMNSMGGQSENGAENIDMSKMLNTFMPGIENKKNDLLMNNLMNDITSKMGNLESSEQVFEITKELGEKYQNMITSGEIDSTEIIGSLMGLMTDKKFTEELSKIDMSKIKPEEMITKMIETVSPDMLGGVENGNLDLSNIGSLISGITGGVQKPVETNKLEEKELTSEQLKEMEEYYSKLEIKDEELQVD